MVRFLAAKPSPSNSRLLRPPTMQRIVDQGQTLAGDLLAFLVGEERLLLLDAPAGHGGEQAAQDPRDILVLDDDGHGLGLDLLGPEQIEGPLRPPRPRSPEERAGRFS